MSFLQIAPEELATAATQLAALGAALTARNEAAVAPTTAIPPAAADMVSRLQASLFIAYGTLYQQISTEAAAIHEQFVNTLWTSAGTYGSTESLNSAAAASPFQAISGNISDAVQATSESLPDSLSGGIANILNVGFGNWASACSNLLGLAGGGLLPSEEAAAADAAIGGVAELGEIGATEPAEGALGLSEAPLAAGVGEAASIGALSVPPSWAGQATLLSSTTTSALQGSGWTAAAPQAAPGTLYPGMPGLASTARNSAGFGAPRYGVKPLVMPKPVSV